jgi:hypothetical protein
MKKIFDHQHCQRQRRDSQDNHFGAYLTQSLENMH